MKQLIDRFMIEIKTFDEVIKQILMIKTINFQQLVVSTDA